MIARVCLTCIAVLFAIGEINSVTANFVIVEDGQAAAAIVLPAKPSKQEKHAADEIALHVEKITGAKLAVVSPENMTKGMQGIYLGAAADQGILEQAQSLPNAAQGYVIRIGDNRIDVVGVESVGTQYGGVHLLELLGVRWYMPGELGTVLPDTRTLTLQPTTIVESPSFESRRTNSRYLYGDWLQRMRLGGIGPPATLRMPDVGDFEKHPNRYALHNGERHAGQLCVSNPETVEQVSLRMREHFKAKPNMQWFSIGNHGGSHCECNDCRAMDTDAEFGPYTGGLNVTDRYLNFVDRIFEAIGDDLPDKRIALTVAAPHMGPPVKQRGHPRMDVIAWTASFCRIHGANDPICEDRQRAFAAIKGWTENINGKFYERCNWGNIAGPGFLFPGIHRYRHDMTQLHAIGVQGFLIGAYCNWASEHPSMYIAAKLAWDHDADVDAVLDEFYKLYYGPAEKPMRSYHELLESTMSNADLHAGTAMDIPAIFTSTVREEAGTLLAQAIRQTGKDTVYGKRIDMLQHALTYTNLFCDMIEKRNAHDYAAANQLRLKAYEQIEHLLTAYDKPMIGKNYARTYFDIFFGNIVEEAYNKTSGGNQFVHGFDDEWFYRMDPRGIAEEARWQIVDITHDRNWKKMPTLTSNWSREGWRYFLGDCMYRQFFEIDRKWQGKQIMLWVGAIDERATVWVNGKEVGSSPVAAFKPFEMDVTDALNFTTPNAISILVGNHTLDELGTGGIIAPVFLYAKEATDE